METRELDSSPSLPPLYAKATLGLIPGRKDEVPAHALRLSAADVDARSVAEYARVCGFRVANTMPPTYPHVLAFPLALCLMTEREFPFALLGLVHIANRIEQRAPLPIDSSPALRVWAENLREHRRGQQLDVVSEASVDGEVAWLEHSTYLRTGEGSGGRAESGEEEDRFARAETAAVWQVPGDIGRRYAAVSGDRNPIHLHALSARLFGFPGAIAHGMWTYARAIASLGGHLPARHTTTGEFRAPLRIPGRARLLSIHREDRWELAVDSPDGSRRHLELSVTPFAT
jgi:acyl dehydratase